jgi:hypothetical protein
MANGPQEEQRAKTVCAPSERREGKTKTKRSRGRQPETKGQRCWYLPHVAPSSLLWLPPWLPPQAVPSRCSRGIGFFFARCWCRAARRCSLLHVGSSRCEQPRHSALCARALLTPIARSWLLLSSVSVHLGGSRCCTARRTSVLSRLPYRRALRHSWFLSATEAHACPV